MEDITTPVPPEEMKKLVRRCLQRAAHINYAQLLEYAQIKGSPIKDHRPASWDLLETSSPAAPCPGSERRLEQLLRLGELCLDVLQQNQEHHAEVGLQPPLPASGATSCFCVNTQECL